VGALPGQGSRQRVVGAIRGERGGDRKDGAGPEAQRGAGPVPFWPPTRVLTGELGHHRTVYDSPVTYRDIYD
jgi:hypothetical protein